jgi:hypothetical protein
VAASCCTAAQLRLIAIAIAISNANANANANAAEHPQPGRDDAPRSGLTWMPRVPALPEIPTRVTLVTPMLRKNVAHHLP